MQWAISLFAALKGQPIQAAGKIQLLAFCVFEVCVGVFWPSMMKMRATYVPEELRATIINLFRIPLNLFVCIVLYNVSWGTQLRLAATAFVGLPCAVACDGRALQLMQNSSAA